MIDYPTDLMKASGDELLEVWAGKPFFHYTVEQWLEALRPPRDVIVDDDERDIFDALPDLITIYRGSPLEETASQGWAWSTDEKIGHQFASHWNPPPPFGSSYMAPIPGGGFFAVAQIEKHHAAMFTNRRNESEIVLHPDVWIEIDFESVTHRPAA